MTGKKDNFLRNVIITFGALMGVLIIVIISMQLFGPMTSYSDFDYIEQYSLIDDQKEDVYGVYFYSEECGACNSIKANMIEFANGNELDMKLYLLDAYNTSGDRGLISGPGGAGLDSTPTLMIFKDGNMVDFIVNGDNINSFFDAVEAGTYTIN